MRKADYIPEQWQEHLRRTRERLRAWRAANRDRFNKQRREHRKRNLAKRRKIEQEYNARNRARRAAASRRRRTGMTPEMYEQLVQLQKDLCAGCGRAFALGRRCADHDHTTGEPRGLLCIHCNAIEGHAKKLGYTPGELGRRIDEYLAAPPAKELKKCH